MYFNLQQTQKFLLLKWEKFLYKLSNIYVAVIVYKYNAEWINKIKSTHQKIYETLFIYLVHKHVQHHNVTLCVSEVKHFQRYILITELSSQENGLNEAEGDFFLYKKDAPKVIKVLNHWLFKHQPRCTKTGIKQRLASTFRVTAKALFAETLCAGSTESQAWKRWSELLQRCTSSPSDNQCSWHTVAQRGTQRQCRGLAGDVAQWNLPKQQPSPAR